MEAEITQLLEKFNETSLYGKLDIARECLHPNVVFVGPDPNQILEGREACLESILEYHNTAKTKSFRLVETKLLQDEPTKLILMRYQVTYEINEKSYKELGSELIMVIKEGGVWKIFGRFILQFQPLDSV